LRTRANATAGFELTRIAADSEFVGILSHGETGKRLARALALHLDAKDGGGLIAGGTEDGEGGQGLAIKARNEKTLLATRFLPNLADLYFGNGHFRGARASCGAPRGFGPFTATFAGESAFTRILGEALAGVNLTEGTGLL
jgi:hypothetical protein